MYTEHELKELRKAIYENAADQLLWQILYINAVAQHAPNLSVVRNKLLSLPKNFELIMLNSVNSPTVRNLTQAVYEGNRLFVEYVDCVFHGGDDKGVIRQKLDDNIQYITKCLCQINPQWGDTQWKTMIHHQIELMNTVMYDAKEGKYEDWSLILPVIRRLKMDMADYLAHGISGLDQARHHGQEDQTPSKASS